MQLLEFQAKELLGKAGAPVPSGFIVRSSDVLGNLPFNFPAVVKSQVPVGGRGKLGGIKLAASTEELEKNRRSIEKLKIKGYLPESVLIEQALDIKRELYLSLRVNRDKRRVEFLVSPEGGVEVETAAKTVRTILPSEANYPEKIAEILSIDPVEAAALVQQLEKCFYDNDLLLLEVNPLVETGSGELVCADAKVTVDDNAYFRHPDLPWPKPEAIKPLGGTIGVIANGAGMAMSTMDTIYAAGGKPANFLDIGGGTGKDVFVENLSKINRLPGLTSIIVNIFAGITRCDDIARGIIAAKKQIPGLVPLYIRLEGTRRTEAAQLLDEAEISMEPNLASCIDKALGEEVSKLVSWKVSKLESEKDEKLASLGVSKLVSESLLFSNHSTIVQGITGHHGSFHTQHMIAAGTNIVAGITPGKGGETIHGVSVYNTVAEAVAEHQAATSVIFVPAKFVKQAALEAIEAGIKLLVIITEGIPIHDMLKIHEKAEAAGTAVIGPNCPGFIVPGSHKLGIIASHITKPGKTTVISRSGTLTYELADALSKKGIGQGLILGIGGDPVQGMDFIEALQIAENDPGTDKIILVGEIGGEGETMAADFIEEHVTKPVYGLVVGHSLPPGQTFGHAGAIVGSRGESAAEKTAYMAQKGIFMSKTLDQLISQID